MTPSIACRFASRGDRAAVVEFLAAHWRDNHIFVRCPELLDWQHWDADRSRYNLAIAADTNGRMLSLLGFVPLGQFDKALGHDAVALAIWVSAPGAPPGLGAGVLRFLRHQLSPSLIFAIGLSQGVIPIYKALGFTVGRLDHCVFLNPSIKSFSIASGVPESGFNQSEAHAGFQLEPLSLGRLDEVSSILTSHPMKSAGYLAKRYGCHPAYEYQIYGVRSGDRLAMAFVCRDVAVGSAKATRIVDVIGSTSVFAGVSSQLAAMLERTGAEYLDIYSTGIPKEDLTSAGFLHRQQTPGLMIPNHFEPFEPVSVELDYAWHTQAGTPPPRLCRGDSDQDRPNVPFQWRTGLH